MKEKICFASMHEDGCMILIFEKRGNNIQKTENWNPPAYFLYFPFGMLVIFPGRVPHAIGFCRDGVELVIQGIFQNLPTTGYIFISALTISL